MHIPGTYRYSDGTLAGTCGNGAASCTGFSYHNFQSPQPNNYGGVQNCVDLMGGNAYNDDNCLSTNPFTCEIPECIRHMRSTEPVVMSKGEVRYLELLAINDEDSASSLLSLTIDDGARKWTTSEVRGLSAEFFRLVRTREQACSNFTVHTTHRRKESRPQLPAFYK